MAYVKVKPPIKDVSGLKRLISYTTNEHKTDIGTMHMGGLVSSNASPTPWDTASLWEAMEALTHRAQRAHVRGRHGEVIARHIIQSFKPGEIDPQAAHDLGGAFIEEITGGQYLWTLATHVDRDHIHNHIVLSLINTHTLRRMRITKGWIRHLRGVSDRLCHAHGLSIINPSSSQATHSHSYAEASGRTSYGRARALIDEAIARTYTWEDFLTYCHAHGAHITWRRAVATMIDNRSHARPIRLHNLGPTYSERAIRARLGRESIREISVHHTLATRHTKDTWTIIIPHSHPHRYMHVPATWVADRGKSIGVFLPTGATLTLFDRAGAIAESVTTNMLAERFNEPYTSRLLPRNPTRFTATTRHTRRVAAISTRAANLQAHAALTAFKARLLPMTPKQRDNEKRALHERLDAARAHLIDLIVEGQTAADTGTQGEVSTHITATMTHIRELTYITEHLDEPHVAKEKKVDPHERNRPVQHHYPRQL